MASFLLSHDQNKGLLRRMCVWAVEVPRQRCKADFIVLLSQAVRNERCYVQDIS